MIKVIVKLSTAKKKKEPEPGLNLTVAGSQGEGGWAGNTVFQCAAFEPMMRLSSDSSTTQQDPIS